MYAAVAVLADTAPDATEADPSPAPPASIHGEYSLARAEFLVELLPDEQAGNLLGEIATTRAVRAAFGLPPAEGVGPAELEADVLLRIFTQGVPLPELKKRIQSQAIARALRMTEGNITRAAEMLGMRRPRLSQIINADEDLKALCQGASR